MATAPTSLSADLRTLADRHLSQFVQSVLAWTGALLFLFVMLLLLQFYDSAWEPLDRPSAFVLLEPQFAAPQLVQLAVLPLPLWLMRRNPLGALVVLVVALRPADLVPLTMHVWVVTALIQVTVLIVTATRPIGQSLPIVAVVTLLEATIRDVWYDGDLVLVMLAIGAGTWLTGTVIRQRRRIGEANRVQRTNQVAMAVQNERLRIARDLHDMVAHSIGVIAIQAGAGRRVIDSQPGHAAEALAVIEETSRETLTGLRRILTALRAADPSATDPSSGGPATGEALEQADSTPGLDDIDRLVTRAREAGVRVRLQRTGEPHPLPPDVDLAAYRILQEALTNVIRHADTDSCQVLVDQRPEDVFLEVRDHGRGAGVAAESDSPSGYGIPGMRERVALLNGDFSAGPGTDSGFVVAARLPVPASVTA